MQLRSFSSAENNEMSGGFDNPTLNLQENITQENDTAVSTHHGSIHDDFKLQSPPGTVVDVSHTDTERTTSKHNCSISASDQVIHSRWLSTIVAIVFERRGQLFAFLSALFLSITSLFLDLASKTLSAFQTIVLAMPVVLIGTSLGIIITKASRPKRIPHYLWLLLGGISLSLALTTFTQSFTYLDMADAMAITHTSLIFVVALSWIILKEPPRLFDPIFSFIAFVGVVFIARPQVLFGQPQQDNETNSAKYYIGIVLALGTAVAFAMVTICFRKQNQLGINNFLSIFTCALCMIVINTVICSAANQWTLPGIYGWMYASAAGLCFFLGHLCLILSLNLVTATVVNIVLTFQVVFAFLWQFLFLGVSPLWTSYIGALLLIFANVGISLFKNKCTKTNIPDQQLREKERDKTSNESIEIG
ncbi:solute carrier family 35 member G1-like isoform X1 [Apostichopus japonicus]|uniref:solute carrier family 35 member G1-like isoform X1 n=2 Tax=Stichopus japonicus TaxID=307972 RepID=UPI003AB71CEC